MTDSSSAEVLVGLAVVVYLCSRQLTWRPVDPSRIWRMPIVLGAFGVFSVAQSSKGSSITWVDIVIVVVSAALSLASGIAMARIARLRPISPDRLPPGSGRPEPTMESRTGWLGVGLWVALIGLRLFLDVVGRHAGAELATSTGMIFLVIALNRAARTLVLVARLDRNYETVA